ncbi:hypothetical protein E2C01_076711 [Portunus trituberculatus]|uniref:Uncharacterized protein n=1 Tax=Portunus trituberculatus TaxID=210409 RepID=A0A5B7IJN7_PORTR|nr:hypothetical protein [Portunus trituberculatus]
MCPSIEEVDFALFLAPLLPRSLAPLPPYPLALSRSPPRPSPRVYSAGMREMQHLLSVEWPPRPSTPIRHSPSHTQLQSDLLHPSPTQTRSLYPISF